VDKKAFKKNILFIKVALQGKYRLSPQLYAAVVDIA